MGDTPDKKSTIGPIGSNTGILTPKNGIQLPDDSGVCMMVSPGGEVVCCEYISTETEATLYRVTLASGTRIDISSSARIVTGDGKSRRYNQFMRFSLVMPIVVNEDNQLMTIFGARTDGDTFDSKIVPSVISFRFRNTVKRMVESKMPIISPEIINGFASNSGGNPPDVATWSDLLRYAKAGSFDYVIDVEKITDTAARKLIVPDGHAVVTGSKKGQIFSIIR